MTIGYQKLEVGRLYNWTDGKVYCLGCGRAIELRYNGGELDGARCCGFTYQTECVRVDLVIYQNEREQEGEV